MPKQFEFVQIERNAIFDNTPHQTRMGTCYRDLKGTYHLFIDYVDTAQHTQGSWNAEVRYYRSPNLKDWRFVETAVPHGEFRGRPEDSDPDFIGAASSHVLAAGGRAFVFYAGRFRNSVEIPYSAIVGPDDPAYLGCNIMYASARLDEQGAPCEPFVKQGVIASPWGEWASQRLDDPYACLEGDTVHLYFKGRTDIHGSIAYARASLEDMSFEVHPTPVLPGAGLGGEAPRVFRHRGRFHMFYHPFNPRGSNAGMWEHYAQVAGLEDPTPPEAPALWQHYVSEDGLDWKLYDPDLWDSRKHSYDLNPIFGLNGALLDPPLLLASGTGSQERNDEEGIIKLWLYEMRDVS